MVANAFRDIDYQVSKSLSVEVTNVWQTCAFRAVMGKYADELLLDAVESCSLDKVDLRLADHGSSRMLALVVSGSARVFTTSAQGRQATIRYVHKGEVIGLATLLAPNLIDDGDVVAVQAMGVCKVLRLSTRRFRQIVARDPNVIWGLFSELASTLMSSHHMLAENVFQPIRSRVARHLLDMADSRGGQVVVHASPQDIADAIGSVREVVSRATVRLRDAGIIRREGATYVIADPHVLGRIAAAA